MAFKKRKKKGNVRKQNRETNQIWEVIVIMMVAALLISISHCNNKNHHKQFYQLIRHSSSLRHTCTYPCSKMPMHCSLHKTPMVYAGQVSLLVTWRTLGCSFPQFHDGNCSILSSAWKSLISKPPAIYCGTEKKQQEHGCVLQHSHEQHQHHTGTAALTGSIQTRSLLSILLSHPECCNSKNKSLFFIPKE